MKTLIPSMILAMSMTACGMDDSSTVTDSKVISTSAEVSPDGTSPDKIPDLAGFEHIAGGIDQCLFQDDLYCEARFTSPINCQIATFVFRTVKNGYLYLQVKENVLLRQGEYHIIRFDEKPEIHNITDNYSEQYTHSFKCEG